MANQEKTPLWLDIKKEYIDDNIDKLRIYLQKYCTNDKKDSFYQVTITLLQQRIEDLITNLSNRAIYKEDDNSEDPTLNIKLLTLFMLVVPKSELTKVAYIALMGELRQLNPKMSDKLLETTMQCIKHEEISSPGFTWHDLTEIGTDLFVFKVCKQASFMTPLKKVYLLTRYGTAILSKAGLYLTHETNAGARKLVSSGANSIDTGIGVMLRTVSSEKLKQSLDKNIVGMSEYVKEFTCSLHEVKNEKATRRLASYSLNDEVVVRVTEIDSKGNIFVETTDPLYEKLRGRIKYKMASLLYYSTNTLYKYFSVGDCLRCEVTDVADPKFCFDNSFVNFLVCRNQEFEEIQNDFLSKLTEIKPRYYVWMNEFGVPMYTENNGEYGKGDYAILTIDRYGVAGEFGKIYARIEGLDDENYFEEYEVREDCLKSFAKHTPEPKKTVVADDSPMIAPNIISLLLRQLYIHQKSLLNPIERYRFLSNAYIMAEILGDELSASYIKFNTTYLRVLLMFVSKEDIDAIELEPDAEYCKARSTLLRLSIVQLLKEYGKKENSEALAKAIEDFETYIPTIARLARLIQTANSMQGTLSDSAMNVIRREIIKTLSMETEKDTDLEAESGSYLGIESGTQEFKTSIIFPSNNNMQPDEKTQNLNVLRGVCAFLNSTSGGVLYLGVNDQGYVTGVGVDMNFLRLQTLDSYMRYVQDTIKKYFGIDVLPYIRIEPAYDNSVVAIHVEPHPYRVVELQKVAYLRVNAESRVMPENLRQQMISTKLFTDKNMAAAISHLQHACTQKYCVMLRNYSSSNSGSVSDRFVEAYDIRTEDNLIVCYDRNAQNEKKIKVFKINRIGYVEIMEDEPWEHSSEHIPVQVDAFHMTGDKPIQVSLQMDLFCKNLLIEEYPATKNDITGDKKDENVWYYNAKLFSVYGIGRFYMGLADRIKIIDAPELKEYVRNYVKKFNI